MKLILEQRYLFDGSVSAIGHHTTHADAHDPLHPHAAAAAIGPQEVPGPGSRPVPQEARAATEHGNGGTVLIVDPNVSNWQSLVAGVKPNVDVVVLDPAKDGVTQVTQALQGRTGVTNLEFLTDGTPGAITLGGSTLDLATLTARATDISHWSASLSAHADIAFWGCDVGQGSTGAAFLADMHTLTGATVGASSDATGSGALGGNWALEVTTGTLHSDVQPFSAAAVAGYAGVLDTPLPTVTLATSDATSSHVAANTVLLGDTINVSMSFTNEAAHATGFGPYVELFAPNSLTLSNVSSAGTALTSRAVQVVGGSYTNPLTGQTEAAPSGITSGAVYFLALPYGSFTPGEVAVPITAQFDISSGLSNGQMAALVGTPFAIDARAGFEYGAVATGGTPILEATPATNSLTPELVESWITVATMPGEGETATGPDFPVAYTVHLETAPVVARSGVPITHLGLSFALPNGVIASEDGGGTPLTPVASGGGSASISNSAAAGGTEQTVNIAYASLSGTQTVTFSAYVPEFYQYSSGGHAVGTAILDPATGAPVSVGINPAYTFSADSWNSVLISGTGDISGATFDAKSLAVQLVADESGQLPTQDVHYTLKFEVSDYFGVSGLGLSATLGDGLSFNPGYTPSLNVVGGNGGVSGAGLGFSLDAGTETSATINSEAVNTAGSGAHVSYLYDSGTGQTTVNFDVSGLLPGTYGAGTTGSVVFAGTVLDKYSLGTDNVAGAGGFLRESDSVSAVGSGTAGSLYDYQGGTSYSPSVGAISDGTASAVDTLPEGSLSLSVVAIDGVTYAPGATLPTIQPGDVVVYQLVYTLAAPGDFAGLTATAYLPEPVFSTLNPASPNTSDYSASANSAAFTASGNSAANLATGTYNFSTSFGGIQVSSATASEPANSVTFAIGSTASTPYLNTTTGAGATQTVTIDFAVTASSLPFIDGLHLTAQGDSAYTPAQAPVVAFQQTQMVTLGEPLLTNVQQGVVSIVDDNGADLSTAAGIVWTSGAGGAITNAAAASAAFAKAGSASVFTGSSGAAALNAAADNLNVSGAQAGDTVRIVDAVQNTGAYAAYDVVLKDSLSQAFTTGDVSRLTFTRGDGTTLVALDPTTGTTFANAAAEANAFFSTGVLLTVAGDHANPVLSATGSGSDIVYATYDVTLPAATPTGANLTGQASVVAWTNQDLYAVSGGAYTLNMPDGTDGNFADAPAVVSSPATLTDSATVATAAPSITDTITGATDASDSGATVPANSFDTHSATVVPGETVSLSTTVTLPQGVNGNVKATDILPTGLNLVAGSVVATYYDQSGTPTVLPGSDFTLNTSTNTLTLNTASWTVPVHSGGDAAASIVLTYKALVPQTQASPIDTTTWGSNAATGDRTLTDRFAASTEGLSYTATTETTTSITTATANASGVANAVTVTNPLITASITELGGTAGQTVYSGEQLTYQLTLTNSSSTATAYDIGSSIQLPAGVTYVPGSLTETSAQVLTLTDGNVGSNGTAGAGDAISGLVSLAPGQTATFTFQGTVNDNLPAATVLTASARPVWDSLPDVAGDGFAVNAQAQGYSGGLASVSNSVASLTPTLSIIGESNNTSGDGTSFNPLSTITATDGEIVRMRAVLQVPEGQNAGADIVVDLPTGLTFVNGLTNVLLDGSTTVALISPGGQLSSSTVGSGAQQSSSAVVLGALSLAGSGSTDPVTTALATNLIMAGSTTATFNLGTLTDNEVSPHPNYVVVEFNAVVADGTPATGGGAALSTSMHGDTNAPLATPTATVSDTVSVVAPTVTLTKTIDGIVHNGDGSATVTYTDIVANTGNSPAYTVALDDPGASATGTIAYIGTAPGGNGGGTVSGTPGADGSNHFTAALSVLGGGDSQSFTYSVTIPANQIATAVSQSDAPATVTSYALNPLSETGASQLQTTEALISTSLIPPRHSATAFAGLDEVSGSVNQDVSATGDDTSLVALSGQTVSVTLSGGTETVSTDAGGSYTLLVPDNAGPVTIHVTTVSPPAPENGPSPTPSEALNNGPALTAALPSASVTTGDPVDLTFTPATGTNYTGVAFDFHRALDTAPVLVGGPGAPFTTAVGTPIVPFANATVSDTQLDGTFSHDYSGTTLTVQRYVGGTATPDGTDAFGGSGVLSFAGGNVVLNNVAVGTFTQTGGVLSIRFADTGITNATVNGVLDRITYSSTAGGNTTLPGIVIGARIDDANNDPVVLSGGTSDPTGPHDQGPGGDLLSNVLTASVTVNPIAPGLSIVGESNVTTGGSQVFDPTAQTQGSAVTATDGDIVRMRAVVQLPEGANSAADIVVTLPNGLRYQNDGSTDVLLVTPNGNAGTALTGSGLQYAYGNTPVDLTRLSLGGGSTDPVSAPLNGAGAISVSGQTVTFNLGTITNPTAAAGANYVIVEFNAVVGDYTAATSSPLSTAMHGDSNAASTATVNDYVNVVAPSVSLTKTVEDIVYNPDGTVTVTYEDTETNSGNSPAYNVRLTDPGAGTGTAAYAGTSGGGTVSNAGAAGGEFDSVLSVLPVGAARTFTFTETIPASQIATAVSDSTAQAVVTWNALNPVNETGGQETLAGTSRTPASYTATATAGLDTVSGTVNQDVAPASGTDAPLVPLAGQAVSVSFPGQTGSESTITDATGHYTVLVPDSSVPITLTVTTAAPHAPVPDTLDNAAELALSVPGGSVTGTNPVVLHFTTSPDTTYQPVAFDFWRPLDTAPALAGGPGSSLAVQSGSAIVPFPHAAVSDAQLDGSFAHDYSGTTLTVERYVGSTAAPDATDAFAGSGGLSLSNGPSGSGNVVLSGTTVGTYTEAGGVLIVKFANTGVTATTVDAVLNAITYTSNLPGNPAVPGVVIGARIDDANNDPVALNGNATDPTGPHDQGPGGDLLSNVLTATINVQGGGSATTFYEPNDANPAAASVAVDATIDLSNIAHTIGTPTQITLAITNGHAEDVLTFANTPDITGSYSNGTMTLSAVSGHTPAIADWQAAVRSVQYYDSSDVPVTTTREVTVTVTAGGNAAVEPATVAIVPVNDSPILDTAVAVSLDHSAEYQGTGAPTPVGAVGTLVSQIAGLTGSSPANVSDPDGAGLVDGASPSAPGIAITGASTTDAGGRSVGTWYYSTDNGGTWTAFPAGVSATQPLDLSATARIAFQPTATNFNGQIPNAITFRAWDGFDGTRNGTQANLAGNTVFGQAAVNNSAATAYSIATETLPLTVDNVNNAPDAAGAAALPPVSTAQQHPTGQTVGQLFGGGFSDPLDSQNIPVANPAGSASNGFAGIAVTGNAATHSQGVWEYSVDGGHSWTAIGTDVSLHNAVILPAQARIAFQPLDGYSGHPGQLTVNVIDSSGTSIAPNLTGAQLASEGSGGVALAAVAGVDLGGVGGSTGISATSISLGTLVNPLSPVVSKAVIDAPPVLSSGFPDDLQHEPTGMQFWTTDDYLGRPLIPDISLVGSVANRFIIVEQHAVITVPPNIFQDSLPQAQLTYEAKLPDGSSLPSWLTFNPNDLTFSGTPPAHAYGRLEVLIRARDIAGNTADATFNILIGREQEDLVGLLTPNHHRPLIRPTHVTGRAHGLREAAAALGRAEHGLAGHAAHRVDHVAAQAALLAGLPPAGAHAGGFTSALHAAGPMSALSRARAWLDNLEGTARRSPPT